ncbi:PilZ domain-containing protein [Microvirga aerilata]|uniref:PilZ domain-containing protein n=1 Tax=Microvirga aerilata TaxID=670292 RepID=A0A937CZA6_9HYPH|nr:PilZ domain-containing protein [Microvirga aerilata]MBL0407998.1 PilZ domain-containing protein [Microvirga aerilata]
MHDRRSSKRLPSILEGRITLDGEMTKIICTVRNLSVTGARIWIPEAIDLSGEFNLEIPWTGQTVRVRLAWSKGQTHGLMFLADLHPEPNTTIDSLSGDLPH